jgi:ABC-type Mn2+/Zn2+ transport system permease subunit
MQVRGPSWDLVADFRQIFQYEFMQNAFVAGTIVALLAGIVGYFVVLRRLGFASEALSHGGFAGATGAVVLGQDVFLGLVAFTSISGALMGLLGDRLRGRDVAIGGTLAFSLALGSLFLTLSTRFAGQAVNILFGNILSIAANDVRFIAAFALLALCLLGAMYRPLLFASVDAEIADARGVPVRLLSVAFMVLLAITVSASVQVVGRATDLCAADLARGGGAARDGAAEQGDPAGDDPGSAVCVVRPAGRLLSAVSAQLLHHHVCLRWLPDRPSAAARRWPRTTSTRAHLKGSGAPSAPPTRRQRAYECYIITSLTLISNERIFATERTFLAIWCRWGRSCDEADPRPVHEPP